MFKNNFYVGFDEDNKDQSSVEENVSFCTHTDSDNKHTYNNKYVTKVHKDSSNCTNTKSSFSKVVNRLFNFKEPINRRDFAIYYIATFVVNILVIALGGFLLEAANSSVSIFVSIFTPLFEIVTSVAMLALVCARLRDIGSKWWFGIVSFIYSIAYFILMVVAAGMLICVSDCIESNVYDMYLCSFGVMAISLFINMISGVLLLVMTFGFTSKPEGKAGAMPKVWLLTMFVSLFAMVISAVLSVAVVANTPTTIGYDAYYGLNEDNYNSSGCYDSNLQYESTEVDTVSFY